MPEKKQDISVPGYTASQIQEIAFGAFSALGWNVKYAGENVLVAYTPRKWNKYDDEITVVSTGNQITVTSKMIHGESFDMAGRNKKHLAAFSAAFENAKRNISEPKLNEWNEKIRLLKQDTIKAADIEVQQASDVDKVMNLSSGNMYLTYVIMGVNILMFILTIVSGVPVMKPMGYDLLPWGANYPPLTNSGEWWRLFTSMFLHFGIIHIAFNMYALYTIGVYLEPMMGKIRYLTAYICSGIIASVVSLWWHSDGNIISAGASGAIFGLYGVFLALLTTNLIPKHLRNSLLQSIGIFIAYNVFYGFTPGSGIDNAAHLGGLGSGMVIGYLFFPSLRSRARGKKGWAVAGFVVLATVVVVFLALRGSDNDDKLYHLRYYEFAVAEEKAIVIYKKDNQTLEEIEEIVIPAWEEADKAINLTRDYKLSAENQFSREKLVEYIALRKKEAKLRQRAIKEDSFEYNEEINDIVEQLNAIIAALNEQKKK